MSEWPPHLWCGKIVGGRLGAAFGPVDDTGALNEAAVVVTTPSERDVRVAPHLWCGKIVGGRPGAAFGPVDDTGSDERSSVVVTTQSGEMPEWPKGAPC